MKKAYVLLLLLGITFWFSSQQGKNSHDMSQSVCGSVVDFLNDNGNLELSEKQYADFVKFLDKPVRKLAHMAEYALVGAVLFAMVSAWAKSTWKQILAVTALLTAAGGMDEIHQLYVAAREGKWQDVVFDVIGGSIGMAVMLLWRTMRKKR